MGRLFGRKTAGEHKIVVDEGRGPDDTPAAQAVCVGGRCVWCSRWVHADEFGGTAYAAMTAAIAAAAALGMEHVEEAAGIGAA